MKKVNSETRVTAFHWLHGARNHVRKRYAETDMFVGGRSAREIRENTHYAADMFTAGEKRALETALGRVVVAGAGNEAVRGVAEDRCEGTTRKVDRRGRSVLEA